MAFSYMSQENRVVIRLVKGECIILCTLKRFAITLGKHFTRGLDAACFCLITSLKTCKMG